MRLSGIRARIVNPIDAFHLDEVVFHDGTTYFDGKGHKQHENYLQPERVLFKYPEDWPFQLEVLSQSLLIYNACLDLPLHNSLVEGHWVLVVEPDRLKIVLEANSNCAHDGYNKYDKVSEVSIIAHLHAIDASTLELRLPFEDGEDQAHHGEQSNCMVKVLPVPIVIIVLLNKLASDCIVTVLKQVLIKHHMFLSCYLCIEPNLAYFFYLAHAPFTHLFRLIISRRRLLRRSSHRLL